MTGRILRIVRPEAADELPQKRRGRKPLFSDQQIRDAFSPEKTDEEIAASLGGVSAEYIRLRRMQLRLLRRTRIKNNRTAAALETKMRHRPHSIKGKSATVPAIDHPALEEARTIYPGTVVPVEGLQNVLISGVNSRKIGSHITKGPAKGWPIYTLTIEERATCPSSCRHWSSCYGNNLHLAKRIQHGSAFEQRLEAELAVLQSRHPGGFAIRLHILGDFYSVEYVRLWARFLKQFRSMLVFGFSARWERTDPIAMELVPLVMAEWPRFAIRFSNAPVDECSTVSIEHPRQKPADAIICPAQIGKTSSCGACGLCWHSRRRVAFLQH